MSRSAVVVLAIRPGPKFLSFVADLATIHARVYVCVDAPPIDAHSSGNSTSASLTMGLITTGSMPYRAPTIPNVTFIQYPKGEAERAGYLGSVSFIPGASSRCKALYYFCSRCDDPSFVSEFDHLWMIEEDVFVPKTDTMHQMDHQFPAAGMLSPTHQMYRGQGNEWHWPKVRSSGLAQPWFSSMICAIRISWPVLRAIRDFVASHRRLAFCEVIFNTLAHHAHASVITPPQLRHIVWRNDWDHTNVTETFSLYHPIKSHAMQFLIRERLSNSTSTKPSSELVPTSAIRKPVPKHKPAVPKTIPTNTPIHHPQPKLLALMPPPPKPKPKPKKQKPDTTQSFASPPKPKPRPPQRTPTPTPAAELLSIVTALTTTTAPTPAPAPPPIASPAPALPPAAIAPPAAAIASLAPAPPPATIASPAPPAPPPAAIASPPPAPRAAAIASLPPAPRAAAIASPPPPRKPKRAQPLLPVDVPAAPAAPATPAKLLTHHKPITQSKPPSQPKTPITQSKPPSQPKPLPAPLPPPAAPPTSANLPAPRIAAKPMTQPAQPKPSSKERARPATAAKPRDPRAVYHMQRAQQSSHQLQAAISKLDSMTQGMPTLPEPRPRQPPQPVPSHPPAAPAPAPIPAAAPAPAPAAASAPKPTPGRIHNKALKYFASQGRPLA